MMRTKLAAQLRSGLAATIAKALSQGARLAELHPYTWKLAWEAIHYLTFLLPHDKSYLAIRHFVAIKPTGLFLDIGANDGISALSFRRFSKDYNILSLEPNPALEGALKRVQARDPKFEYRMLGAGDREAQTQFFVPSYHGIVLHTFSGTSHDAVSHAVAVNFGERIARHIRMDVFNADIILADQLNVRPAIIKIDAEGFDLQVLQGLRHTIISARPFIIIEVSENDAAAITHFFDELDYAILDYELSSDRFLHTTRARSSVPAATGYRNSFAVPRELVD
jgi:FkbM family methyltransferase